MKGLHFLNFDLTFQRTTDGYRAQVLDSPAGQASIEFTLPFSDLEVENFFLRFGRKPQSARRIGASPIRIAETFGGRLFEAAFDGEVRSCLRSSLDEVDRLEAGLRIRLRFTDAPELNDLPWEFLFQPLLDRFFALSVETPLVRYLDLPERIRPLAVKPPLEVLTVISSPTDCTPLDVEAEWRKLQESVKALEARGLLVLRRLESATLFHLQQWLRREACHIFHFIGHGGFNPTTDEGLLLFTDEKGRGLEVTGQTLGTLLHDHRPLRLAVLNACEGARTSRSDPFAGVAQSLVRQGIPAVVAMQFEVSDTAAIAFAHEFYAAVADGYPVDAALGESRKALFCAGHELEWGTPVLYMRSPDGQIFDIEPAAVAALKVEPTAATSVPNKKTSAPAEAKPKPMEPKVPPAVPPAVPNAPPVATVPPKPKAAPPPQPKPTLLPIESKAENSTQLLTAQEQGRLRQASGMTSWGHQVAEPAPKKGMEPFVWVAIGFGSIALLGILALTAGGWFVKRPVDKYKDNPSIVAAELAVRANPDLELISSDREKGTMTVKDKTTGKTTTVNASDIENGNITFETDQGKTVIDASGSGEDGSVKMSGPEGEEVTLGSNVPKDLPAWVPVYPGSTVQGAMDSTNAEGRTATFSIATDDSVDEVVEFYESKLNESGFKVTKNMVEADGQRSGILSGVSEDDRQNVTVMLGQQEGKTQASVTFAAKN